MQYQNLIFDLDGTLVDSLPGIHSSMKKAIEVVLPGETMPEMKRVLGPPLLQMFQKMWPKLSEQKINELVVAFRADYDLNGFLKSQLYPDVVEVLRALKIGKKNLYLLTNKPKIPTQLILKHLGIAPFFIDCMSPDTLNPPFTEKGEGLRDLQVRHSMEINSSVMIGDSVDDAIAAQETGVGFIAAEYGYGEVLRSPEFAHSKKIENLWQLRRYLFE